MDRELTDIQCVVNQVSQRLTQEAQGHRESVANIQRELSWLSVRFSRQKCPSPKRLDKVIRQLRKEAFWRGHESDRATPEMNDISNLADQLEKRKRVIEDCWIYRPWLYADTYSFSLTMILTLPAYLTFIICLCVGISVLTSSVVIVGYLACVVGVALWVKDIPGLYWSVYGMLSIIGLSFHLLGR